MRLNETIRSAPHGLRAGRADEAGMGAYLASVERPFQALKVVAGQLAGVLLTRAAGLHASTAIAPALAAAEATFAEALDLFRSIAVPPGAAHRHAHLNRAFDDVGVALARLCSAAPKAPHAAEAALATLRRGWAELQKACEAGTGLATVDFGQCCARALDLRPGIICTPGAIQ